MKVFRREVQHVIGPDGSPLRITDLPPPQTKRWVVRRKAEVVAAVRGGLLSLEQACQLYRLDREEFHSWEYCIDRYGLVALKATHVQFYVTNPKRLRRLKSRSPDVIGKESCPVRRTGQTPPLSGCARLR